MFVVLDIEPTSGTGDLVLCDEAEPYCDPKLLSNQANCQYSIVDIGLPWLLLH